MKEKFLTNSEEETLYEQCMQIIKFKQFNLLKDIELTLTEPEALVDSRTCVLLYFIYFYLLSPTEQEPYYNLKMYIYEDLANLRFNDLIDFYNSEVKNMPLEEKYLWEIGLIILKKYTNNPHLPNIDFDFAVIPKLNTFIHKTKFQHFSSFTMKMLALWIGCLKDKTTIISEYDKMFAELNIYNIFTTMPLHLSGDDFTDEKKEEFLFIEDALSPHII